MKEKDLYLSFRAKEYMTTQRVMRAFPEEQVNFRPHEISRTAKGLFLVFLNEEYGNRGVVYNTMDFPQLDPKDFASLSEIVSTYEALFNQVTEEIKRLPKEAFDEKIGLSNFTSRKGDVLWMLLFDSIHHRGQLTVYLRMAGGKVPSIYGPSHDEPMKT